MEYPGMYSVRQMVHMPSVDNIEEIVTRELAGLELHSRIRPGDRIAVTAGSRGINHVDQILGQVIKILKKYRAEPFIVPAMGSHGGGTAQGQLEILKSLNITEATMGVPIISSMEVVQIGVSSHGFPVLVDKHAAEADGVVVINRIKPHTEFEGPIESGLMKMMAIGLGKHKGCTQVHRQTVNYGYSKVIPEIGSMIFNKIPVVFGVGIVENIYDETACIKACLPHHFHEIESLLLEKAKQYMARLPFDDIDILIIDEMGKNISGTGMDTNVIGRIMFIGEKEPDSPRITRIAVLDLTEASHGNAIGIGLADLTTQNLIEKLDTKAMATNALAAMTPEKARIPIGLATHREVVDAALEIIGAVQPTQARIVHIKNTLEMGTIHVSHGFKAEMEDRKDLVILDDLGPLSFDANGRLATVDFL
ncbi:MAG: lactate racemase domain-containing protein [Desulfobacterium sp.]